MLVAGLAHREDERDPFRQQPAGDERERLRGDPVQPLRVIDEAQQRLLLRDVGQQAEHRQPDQETVRRLACAQTERRRQRIALRTGKSLEAIEERRAQLMQAGERELHLGLDARRARDPAP